MISPSEAREMEREKCRDKHAVYTSPEMEHEARLMRDQKLGRPGWDDWLMGMSFWVSLRSPDTSTKHGAVLCDQYHRILGMGYNGFPRGCNDVEMPMTRPLKYLTILHAEENCLLSSQNLLGAGHVMYITGFPCSNCFARMIQCGIKRVVYGPVSSVSSSSPYNNSEQVDLVNRLSSMCDVDLVKYEGDLLKSIDIYKGIVSFFPECREKGEKSVTTRKS